jgi:hypothetical protein
MALDISGNWESGDDLRVIEVLGLPFGSFTLDCTQNCCNQLEDISADAVLKVKGYLTDWETARTAMETQNLADTEGKTLVKADVLEWERDPSGQMSGPSSEMEYNKMKIAEYFAFCSCMGGLQGGSMHQTPLIRS